MAKNRDNSDHAPAGEATESGWKDPSDQDQTTTRDVKFDYPACQSCRKKKAKCSRGQPCSQCDVLGVECVYDDKKMKPGLRMGAVESLSQRVEERERSMLIHQAALENMFLGQGLLLQPLLERAASLQTQVSAPKPASHDNARHSKCLASSIDALRHDLSEAGPFSNTGSASIDMDLQAHLSSKRRRTTDGSLPLPAYASPPTYIQSENSEWGLPPADLVDSLVEIYFATIHPWIPMLHVRDFRVQMRDPGKRSDLSTIFHAIVSICVRFSTDERLSSPETRARYSKCSRQMVILQSMETFSVQNLQAMVIIAFDTIGSGRGPSAWSVVGSMTRTVEQLQLSVEEDKDKTYEGSAEYLIRRMAFLNAPETWAEAEERRRIFWNVFLMDRFCSVATGWNTSLTSADVRRRLPAEGALWEAGHEVQTPYFGVADKTPSLVSKPGALSTPSSAADPEGESIGGFAYCIEATESLSLVTTFFLQHAVNVGNIQEVQMWLMRFKELDLRLIQWKLFLPPKWREASVLNPDGIMDPNLTLAHITHNASVILLHQSIAYPSAQWQSCPINLPSSSSASTCVTAASEVATISQQFLVHSPTLTNPQFAFAIFISARVLHAHATFHSSLLPPEFTSLISSLQEISRRWKGPHEGPIENLASRFASRLMQAQSSIANSDARSSLDIRQTAYSDQTERVVVSTPHADDFNHHSPDSISLAFPPLPLSFQYSQKHNDTGYFVYSSCPHPTSTSPAPQSRGVPFLPSEHSHMEVGRYNLSPIEQADTLASGVTRSGNPITSMHSFEELNQFFNDPFPPHDRISTFAGRQGVVDGEGINRSA